MTDQPDSGASMDPRPDSVSPADARSSRVLDTHLPLPAGSPSKWRMPIARIGGGVGCLGSAIASAGFILPWVMALAIVQLYCNRGAAIEQITLSALQLAFGTIGPLPATAAWVIAAALGLIALLGMAALWETATLPRARLLIMAAVLGLVALSAESYRLVSGDLRYLRSASGLPPLFQGFGNGLWLMLAGLLVALIGGLLVHGAARLATHALPLAERTLAIACLFALAGLAFVPRVLQPPSPAPLTCLRASDNRVLATAPRLYVTSPDMVYAVRPDDGTLLWRCQDAFGGLQTATAPILADGVLYVGSLDGEILAMRAYDGTLLWRRHLDGSSYESPVNTLLLADEVVYVSAGPEVAALRTRDGSVLWRALPPRTSGRSFACIPSILQDGVLYGMAGGPCALDARTGALLWSAQTAAVSRSQSLALGNGIVFDEESEPNFGVTYLYAHAAHDGSFLWRFPLGYIPYQSFRSRFPFVLDQGTIYVQSDMSSDPQHIRADVHALRAADGVEMWSSVLQETVRVGASWVGGIALWDGVIFIDIADAISDGRSDVISALDARTGTPLWHSQPITGEQLATSDRIGLPCTLLVVDEAVYFVTVNGHVTALNRQSGALLWTHQPPEADRAATSSSASWLVVEGDRAYVAAGDLTALDRDTGSVLWSLAPQPPQAPIAPYQHPTFSPPTWGP